MMVLISDMVENIVGKGENAGNQHFLLFQQYFQNAPTTGSLKVGIMGKGLNLHVYHTITTFNNLRTRPLEKILGKGENAAVK